MGDTFPRINPKILVAVAFDDRLPRLMAAAEFFGNHTGATLRIVHVCDPWARSYLIAAAESGPPDLVQALKEQALRAAGRRLVAVRQGLPAGLTVETEVLSGDVVRGVAADAEAAGAGLIIVGATKGGVAGTSVGFSTAVSLLAETTVPVLVLNEDAALDPAAPRLTVLVADDFSDLARGALDLGFDLAEALPGTTLVHVHVESYEDLRLTRLAPRQAAAPEAAAPTTLAALVERLRQAEETILARCGARPGRLEAAGGRYRAEVVTGSVPDEIARSAAACRADLTIFGQHRVFHRQTRHVGQVPFKAMLSEDRPVIVVPQRR